MLLIAHRNLFQEKGRLFISVGGVAFSVLLIMILQGLYQGWSNKIGEYISNVPANLWVMQAGSENMFHTPSVLPLSDGTKIAAVEGVASLEPFSSRRLAARVNGKALDLYVVGYDSLSDASRPASIAEGKSLPGAGEIIIDRSQSKKIKLGDTVGTAGQQLKVVGFSEGGDIVTSSFAFARKQELNKIQNLPASANYFLVNIKPGFDNNQVIDNIKAAVAGIDVVESKKFVENNTKIISDSFLPVILVLLIIGVAVGIAVIGLTIFTSTVEKSKEYGVLKAVGIKDRQLYGIVVQQALITGVAGYLIGTGLAFGLGASVSQYVPQFVSRIRLFDVLWVFLLTIAMAIIASYIPIRRIAKIDPAEAFKA